MIWIFSVRGVSLLLLWLLLCLIGIGCIFKSYQIYIILAAESTDQVTADQVITDQDQVTTVQMVGAGTPPGTPFPINVQQHGIAFWLYNCVKWKTHSSLIFWFFVCEKLKVDSLWALVNNYLLVNGASQNLLGQMSLLKNGWYIDYAAQLAYMPIPLNDISEVEQGLVRIGLNAN